jgi:hypothetical protein
VIRYLVFPGWLWINGEERFISGRQLIKLYGVDPAKCKIIRNDDDLFAVDTTRYTHLVPRQSGDYTLIGG